METRSRHRRSNSESEEDVPILHPLKSVVDLYRERRDCKSCELPIAGKVCGFCPKRSDQLWRHIASVHYNVGKADLKHYTLSALCQAMDGLITDEIICVPSAVDMDSDQVRSFCICRLL